MSHPIDSAIGYYTSLANGHINLAIGTANFAHEMLTVPIDIVGTSVSMTYQPMSYYGQGFMPAYQGGQLLPHVGNAAANAGSLGWWGYGQGAINWAQTGNPNQWQQAAPAPLLAALIIKAGAKPVPDPDLSLVYLEDFTGDPVSSGPLFDPTEAPGAPPPDSGGFGLGPLNGPGIEQSSTAPPFGLVPDVTSTGLPGQGSGLLPPDLGSPGSGSGPWSNPVN
jgi:hypothetical protein